MKKILLASALVLLAAPSWSAQQPVTQITGTIPSVGSLKTATNSRLAVIETNFGDIYDTLEGNPWLAQTTAPNIHNVFWIDTSGTDPVIKYWDGDSWEVASAGGSGTYSLPVATASVLGGVKQGSGTSIAVDGTISVTAAGISLGTSDNPSFLSLHASGGNLAAANKQVTKAWQTGLSYTAAETSVIHGDEHYIAKTTHTAGSNTEPGVGADWETAWKKVSGTGSVATAIDDLTDVDTTGKADGKILKFNSSGNLVVGVDNEGAGGGITHATSDGNYYASRNGAWASLTGLFAAALGSDDNYATDAEKIKLSNLSGTNSGDNAVNSNYSSLVTNATHTGDVTGSGALTIADNAVTLAKMADMATGSLIYRKTTSTGDPEVNTLATLKTDLGLTGTNSGDQTTVTGNAGSATILQTTRTIGGTSFNGSANIDISYTNLTNKPTLGTAAALDHGTDVGDLVRLGDDGEGNPTLPFTLSIMDLNDGNSGAINPPGVTGQVMSFSTAGALSWITPATIDDTKGNGDTAYAWSADKIYDQLALKIGGSTGSTDNALLRADGTGGSTVQSTGITVDDSDNLSTTGTLSGKVAIVVNSDTAAYSVTQAQARANTLFLTTNTATTTYTLPAAEAGMAACFKMGQGNSQVLRIDTDGTDYIVMSTNARTSAAGDYYGATASATNRVCVAAYNTTDWYVETTVGTWTEEP